MGTIFGALLILSAFCGCDGQVTPEVPKPKDTATSHFEDGEVSFEYSSSLAVPPKNRFDVEKVREMQQPYGIELVTCLMSQDGQQCLQLARSKRDVSLESLYAEKKRLADQINSTGANVMGDQFTKFTVEKLQLSDSAQALCEYGEKANGEVAYTIEFLSGGHDYAFMFIYKNKALAQSGATERDRVLKTFKIKLRQ